MTPTELLKAEHRRIEAALDRLVRLADQGSRTGALDWPAAREVVDILQAFADRCHHGKEEGILFPLLARRGLVRQYGRSGVMVYEHNQGRRHTRHMSRAVADGAAGSPGAVKRFLDHARAYVPLMRRHIDKEDHCLFPWVERNLTAEESAALQQAFDAAARAKAGET
jgi:hemerythrin-like domain-containing protein